jgi:hypothetical protein
MRRSTFSRRKITRKHSLLRFLSLEILLRNDSEMLLRNDSEEGLREEINVKAFRITL